MELKKYLTLIDSEARKRFSEDLMLVSSEYVPNPEDLALEKPEWKRISNLTCVYADMIGSTQLNLDKGAQFAAKIYEMFTTNLVRVLNEFEASYIDVKGDGAFGLFDGPRASTRALCASVTFITFCRNYIGPLTRGKMGTGNVNDAVACRVGMYSGTLLAKRIGMRGDKQNEVWAGRPVSLASKVSEFSDSNGLVVSNNLFESWKSEYIKKTCGCTGGKYTGERKDVWTPIDVEPTKYGQSRLWKMSTFWCDTHGEEYCNNILALD